MKHYDVSLKKFIKNVVCLVGSGILLVAATIAWFSQAGTVKTDSTYASITSQIQFDYLHHAIETGTYLDDSSALKIAKRNTNGTNVSGFPTAIKTYLQNLSSWSSSSATASASDWDLGSMYPGKYGLYKIEYDSDGSGKTVKMYFNTISLTAGASSSVYVYALAQSVVTSGGVETPTDLAVTTSSLSALSAASNTSVSVLNVPAASSGARVRVFYVIGIPATDGTNSNYQHPAALLENGGSIGITKVTVE